jgi:hypothetical protein
MTFEKIWENILEYDIATEEELELVCTGFGATIDNLNTVIYVRTGYRDMEQFLEYID